MEKLSSTKKNSGNLLENIIFAAIRASRNSPMLAKSWSLLFKHFNPIHPDRYKIDGPYKYYDKIREKNSTGIAKESAGLGWVAFSNDWIRALLNDSVNLSSHRMDSMGKHAPYKHLAPETDTAFKRMFLFLDGEEHETLKGAVAEPFLRSAVTDRQESVDKLANELLGELDWNKPVDLVAEFAKQLPNRVIADILGYTSDYEKLQELSDYFVKVIEPLDGFDPKKMDQIVEQFVAITEDLVEKSKNESESFLAQFAQKVDDETITNTDLTSTVMLLIVAGYETTSSMLGNAIVALDQYPEQKEDLRQQIKILETTTPQDAEYKQAQKFLKNAIEELIRYDSSVQFTDRDVRNDFSLTVNGQTCDFKKGEVLTVLTGAGSRDPKVYGEDADQLNLRREKTAHYAFGFGMHACIGAALARMELQAGIKALYGSQAPDFSVKGKTINRSATLRSHGHVTVSASKTSKEDRDTTIDLTKKPSPSLDR